ncbi:PREDICTED: protein BPS1, chloroplastic-like isoform X1 [Lupinus angustifolius]|nr:PREDICTED: protein BPS1, chloroplastic-like isoform X1 [Lupinus angustifolius]
MFSLLQYSIKMGRPQDPHHPRSFFPFGNPFRVIAPKGSHMSPQLRALLQAFEARLTDRLSKLMLKSKEETLSLSWMTKAMESLLDSYNDIRTLISDLELPVSDWDDKWIEVYLDISRKVLDICNAFSSEFSRLNTCNLSLKYALHNLDGTSSKLFVRACSSLDDWKQHIHSMNPRIEKCSTILDNLMRSLDLPKVKNSAKGKILMQAMYGVKVQTAFVCSVFTAAFSGSPKKLIDLDVADMYSWAPAFSRLQSLINDEIRTNFSNGKFSVLIELEVVDAIVKELNPSIQGGADATVQTESLLKTVEELGKAEEKLSKGLDLLAKGVDQFFKVVLTSRSDLLSAPSSAKAVKNCGFGGNANLKVVS